MDEKKKVLPYFVRFLEGIVEEEEQKKIKGGLTHKYPSDRDEAQ